MPPDSSVTRPQPIFYEVTAKTVKKTYCLGLRVAAMVVDDYTVRGFEEVQLTLATKHDAWYVDFGGSVFVQAKPVVYGGLGFWPHQVDLVIRALGKAPVREGISVPILAYGAAASPAMLLLPDGSPNPELSTGYIKIHSQWTCFCLPAAEALKILQELMRDEVAISAEADRQFDEWRNKNFPQKP